MTYQRFKYYKTSYLFKMGETEDIPSRLHGQAFGRLPGPGGLRPHQRLHADGLCLGPQPAASISMAGVDLGGYFHNHCIEDGSFHVVGAYITRLMGGGRFRHRFYATLGYTLAFNRNGG